MHVACPQCGTGYQIEPAALERARLRLRCRRCRHVWDPRQPLAAPAPSSAEAVEPGEARAVDGVVADAAQGATADAAEAATADADAAALDVAAEDAGADAVGVPAAAPSPTAAPRPPRRRLAAMLFAVAGLLVLAAGTGFAWAYRDTLPFVAAAPSPALTEVEPAWRGDAEARRLVLSARVENPGDGAVEIRRVRVTFLNAQGAWIGETMVEIPALTVPAGGRSTLEMAVDRLPEGTASLELSVVPDVPVS